MEPVTTTWPSACGVSTALRYPCRRPIANVVWSKVNIVSSIAIDQSLNECSSVDSIPGIRVLLFDQQDRIVSRRRFAVRSTVPTTSSVIVFRKLSFSTSRPFFEG